MKLTVCQLNDDADVFMSDWAKLVAHIQEEGSDLVLLPEMPFSPWFAATRPFDAAMWQRVMEAHDAWLPLLREFSPAIVFSTRPVEYEGRRFNEGFAWSNEAGYYPVHRKHYLPDEDGFWEATWYERGRKDFTMVQCGAVDVGFLICTELWFPEHARDYGKGGAHLIVAPRATQTASLERWLVAGRAAAIIGGTYCASSNRVSDPARGFGGQGWIVGPNGDVLGTTSREYPFLTCEIDLNEVEAARSTYPRYVRDA
jgi:N-carbamoylputrescine amidase